MGKHTKKNTASEAESEKCCRTKRFQADWLHLSSHLCTRRESQSLHCFIIGTTQCSPCISGVSTTKRFLVRVHSLMRHNHNDASPSSCPLPLPSLSTTCFFCFLSLCFPHNGQWVLQIFFVLFCAVVLSFSSKVGRFPRLHVCTLWLPPTTLHPLCMCLLSMSTPLHTSPSLRAPHSEMVRVFFSVQSSLKRMVSSMSRPSLLSL